MTHLVPVLRPVLGTPFRRGDLYRRAGEVPSFHIAPARTRDARDLITGSVLGTYNSASPAMAVGPDGILYQPAANAPVIEYDPATGACLGARIWEAVVNLSLQSRDLTQAAWSKSGVTPTRDQVGANGVSNTATRLTATSSDGTCLQTITSASATRVSGFYIRRITGTGTVEITQNGGATWTAVSLTGTFARYSIASATILNPQIGFRIRSNGDEIAVDFAQLQSSATLGPAVATTTTAASSTADVWSITGADFTRIFNNASGTIYAQAQNNTSQNFSGTFRHIAQATPATNNDSSVGVFINSSNQYQLQVRDNAVNQASFTTGANSGNASKVAAAYAASDFAISANGGSPGTQASGSAPTTTIISQIVIGGVRDGNPLGALNGYIQELAIFRSRRANANLQAMTQ